MRRVLVIAVAVVAVIVAASVLIGRRPAKPQYIFLVCLDATRPDHLSCYGYGVKTSPRIDALAAKGVLFEDAVSQAPWTTPSVATILSSKFPCQQGVRRQGGSYEPYTATGTNFVQNLVTLGYETALFTGGIALKDKVPTADLIQGALTWLRQNRDKRCLAVIHSYETHSPYVAAHESVDALDPGYSGPYDVRFGDIDLLRQARVGRLGSVIKLTDADIRHAKALYDCQIISADRAVGTLVNSLEAWGLLKRSMIIILADHGEEFLEHGSIEHAQTVYEESIRVPLIIYCPALASRPRRIAEQVGLIDLAPTIFDILGIAKPGDFEGRSLAPLISSRFKASPDTTRPCGLPTRCLVAESIAQRSEKKALRCPPWKLIFDPFFGAAELYNLSQDPHETKNLIDAEPEVAARLTETLLVMEKYYPGGWCLAWRDAERGPVAGEIAVEEGLVEAVAHGFFPEIDARTDSLVTSEDRRSVRFTTTAPSAWKGVEVRMAEPACATVRNAARAGAYVVIGQNTTRSPFPLALCPDSARVERAKLRSLFLGLDPAAQAPGGQTAGTSWQCVLYWLEPGSEPTAKAAKDWELRKQLKAIGYIE
jgi:hypothetical protein